ncbi:hypothetical protein FRC10_004763 [Ceratobasidium sp. 414]|nr:hypothetical protein FRC10_004763 [Ceratobasidium sp. 414]
MPESCVQYYIPPSKTSLSTPYSMAQNSLFAPTSTDIPPGSPTSTKHSVTIPHGTEIVKPAAQLLEQLLPAKKTPAAVDTAQLFKQLFSAKKDTPGSAYAVALTRTQNQARTQKNAKAYHSTESAILDAFSGLNANSSAQDIHKQLAASWHQSPELTLRIIWNMRSIHEGHSNKTGFYHAFGWLYNKHPRTAIENLRFVVERLCERKIKRKPKESDAGFEIVGAEEAPTEEIVKMPHGYYKDLLNIVVLAMRNELGDPTIGEFKSLNVPLTQRTTRNKVGRGRIKNTKQQHDKTSGVDKAKKLRVEGSRKAMAANAEMAKSKRRKNRGADFALLKSKLEHDKPFLALYATVAQIFAGALADDVALLKRIEAASEEEAFNLKFEITGASKWAPTLEGFHDRATNISTAIALVMHARGHMADLPLSLSGEMTQENAHTLRGYYRRWIVSPLRRFTDVTEVKMSAQNWYEIDYRHVPSECMNANKDHFFKHDDNRLTDYLVDVAAGKSKISGATLLPHELLVEALKATVPVKTGGKRTPGAAWKAEIQRRLGESNKQIIDAQWNSLLERMRESGSLDRTLAVVDVSGSMGTIGSLPQKKDPRTKPIFPAVALGILLAQISQPPFKDMFITFSASPELLRLQSGSLAEQARWMVTTKWGMNTDYEAVFLNLLLPTAVKKRIKPEDMVKRLFVFSDMQFDESLARRSGGGWKTTHSRIVKAYKKAGYEMPEIVYWNLQGGTTKPVLKVRMQAVFKAAPTRLILCEKDTPGTALVTGFSANMAKLFMEGEKIEDELIVIGPDGEEEVQKKANDPIAVMEKALSKACYDVLKVYD